MPLFTRELNELADSVGRADLTARLHTQEPTDADPTLGRTTVGGGAYENGVTVPEANLSTAANGVTTITGAIPFGQADENVGTVGWVSFYRGSDAVGYSALDSQETINDGDSYEVNADSISLTFTST